MPLTASIIERSFAYVPDRILKLSGAAFLRPLGGAALFAPWERIRIGILCAANHPATSLTDTMFLVGLCAGQDMPGSAYNTRNFIGASINGVMTTIGAGRTSSYTANSGNPYMNYAPGQFYQKVGTSVTWSANAVNAVYLPIVATAATPAIYQRRGLIILDITKTVGGSGALTMTLYNTQTAATLSNDIRPDHLQQALDQPGVPAVRGLTFASIFTSTGVQYSPLLSDVDTLEIFYSNFNYPLEISAVGVSIVRTSTAYTGTNAAGIADDSFEEYTPSSGSISSPTFLSGGSGWASAGMVADDIYTVNNGNFAPQVYSQFVGTTSLPDEPFEQYATGTVDSLVTVCLGSYWTAPASIVASMANSQPQYGFAGTSAGMPYDTFETYVVNNGSTNPTTSSFADGSYWAGTGTITHAGSVIYVGTTTPNYPMFGSTVLAALAGTTYGTPYDTFEAYAVGTIVSGVTVNAGSYWEGYGTVTTFSYP